MHGDYFINHEIRIPSLINQYFMESNLLGQWLTFWTFGDSIFSRENKPFKRLFFRVHWLSEFLVAPSRNFGYVDVGGPFEPAGFELPAHSQSTSGAPWHQGRCLANSGAVWCLAEGPNSWFWLEKFYWARRFRVLPKIHQKEGPFQW